MGRYDNAIRQLLADNPQELATFLFGPLPRGLNARYAQSELPAETMRADSVLEVVRYGNHVERLVQVEFQLQAHRGDIEPRLVRYWSLLHDPKRPVPEQYVVVLDRKGGRLSGTYRTTNLELRYTAIHLWETPSEELITHPLLFPFATLGRTKSPQETFEAVVHRCNLERAVDRRNMLLATSAILASIALDEPTIEVILRRRPAMPIDYREIPMYEWGVEEGREQGLEQGLERGHEDALSLLISERFGALSPVDQTELTRILHASSTSFEQQMRVALQATTLQEILDKLSTH